VADAICAAKKSRFLSRLLRDEAGNTIAIMAAAVLPVIGLVGGAVDMGRIYLVQSRLQSACDAGVLMGRRVMGTSTWNANGGLANTRAVQMFDTNFAPGLYGTSNRARSYTEDDSGTVRGNASADVPMTLMRAFQQPTRTISVVCQAQFSPPTTDVMFVLDTTGSMNCAPNAPGCTNNGNIEASGAKIVGLRRATMCFYEFLRKENIDAVSSSDCSATSDPSGGNSDIRIRFGFVPYSVNVNVGRLLPLDSIANNWSYQSREPRYTGTSTGWVASYGTGGAFTTTGTNNSSLADEAWIDRAVGVNLAPTTGGLWQWAFNANNASACNITLPPNIPATIAGTRNQISESPSPLTYPTGSVTRTFETNNRNVIYQYRYNFSMHNGQNVCRLQRKATSITQSKVTETQTVPVSWTDNRTFVGWTYKQVNHNISSLKDVNNNSWNNSVMLPLGANGAPTPVNWSGCIEERKTRRVNGTPTNSDWQPIPADAMDMDVNLAPNATNSDTLWGPALRDAIYLRKQNGNNTTDQFDTNTSDSNSNGYGWGGVTENCPSQAALYDEWAPDDFVNYLNNLEARGNTYHDIGLLWGARLMSPNGIFSSLTNDRPNDQVVRHMIFMTDGDTMTGNDNYTAYGVPWWDRRTNNGTSAPDNAWLNANVNARTQALCNWVRSNNINLWVVAFGDNITPTTEEALKRCAGVANPTSTTDDPNDRYFKASNNTDLMNEFRKIANQIGSLRLTQ
jgi:Flp pilus assembly protein TadG